MAVRIPAEIVRTFGLKAGVEVDVKALDDRRMALAFKRALDETLK